MKSLSIVLGFVVSCVLTTGSTLISPLPGQRRCLDMSNAAGKQVLLRCTSTKNIIFSINAMCYTTSSISDTNNRKRSIYSTNAISRISSNISINDSTRGISDIGKCGSQCSGQQLEVLTSSHNCYWKLECNITWSKSPILKSPSKNCLMKVPSYLDVKYQCVRKKRVFFLSKIAGHGPIRRAYKESDYGMIVSHVQYPWVYEAGQSNILTLSPRTSRRRRTRISRNRTRRRRKRMRANKVLVTVDVLDVGQNDAVVVSSGNSTESLVKGSSIVLENTHTFSVRFMVSSEPSSRHGFVLCFYWARGCENTSGEDACKIVRSSKRRRRIRRC
ncbi:uncharacterized protein [Haliotis asinina]|uniref:uncharacterized protein n=1 Tax=Haliotis asinina TaxID=109174 RepID=UPI00353261F7